MRKCEIDQCDKPHKCKGMCSAHYSRFRRGSDLSKPLGAKNGEPRIWSDNHIMKATINECLIWPFSKDHDGYGKMIVGGVSIRASHYSLILDGRARPSDEHVAAHAPLICHNPSCVNPHHLRWATQKENAADELIDKTRVYGERQGNCKLSAEDVIAIRNDNRKPRFIAAEYGCTPANVWLIKNGKSRARCH